MTGMEEFKTALLSLDYKSDTELYADNWKSVVPELIDIISEYPTEFPKDWIFGFLQLETATMQSVCSMCNDVHLFKWLLSLRNAYKYNTPIPEMPSCADCH
jgi:hypothetical protein